MIDSMKRKIPRSGTGNKKKPRSVQSVRSSEAFDVSADFGYRDGSWNFDGTISPEADEFESWRVTIEIVSLGEENNETGDIAIEEFEKDGDVARVNIEDGVLVIEGDASSRSVDISGRSRSFGDFDPYSGRIGRSRLQIDGNVELGGES
jgi:hypothetical protein